MNGLPYPRRAGNKITAAAGNAGCRAVITAGNTAMEKVIWQDE